MDTFLRDLKAKRAADLNGVLVTLNEGGLCCAALRYWLLHEWIVVAPHSPLTAMTGPAFRREIGVREFCGRPPEPELSPEEAGEESDAGNRELGPESPGSQEGHRDDS